MKQRTSLSPTDRLMVWTLTAFADNATGHCFPSQQSLADMSGLSVRQVRRAIKNLESAGLVTCVPGTGRKSTRYTLQFNAIEGGHTVRPQSPGADTQSALGGHDDHPGRTVSPPNYSENSSQNFSHTFDCRANVDGDSG